MTTFYFVLGSNSGKMMDRRVIVDLIYSFLISIGIFTSAFRLCDEEAARFMAFMKFPTFNSIDDYRELLVQNGCEVVTAQATGRFSPCVDLYLNMLNMQLTYDALKIIGFDVSLMEAMAGEMAFMQQLARDGKIVQGLFVARKK